MASAKKKPKRGARSTPKINRARQSAIATEKWLVSACHLLWLRNTRDHVSYVRRALRAAIRDHIALAILLGAPREDRPRLRAIAKPGLIQSAAIRCWMHLARKSPDLQPDVVISTLLGRMH